MLRACLILIAAAAALSPASAQSIGEPIPGQRRTEAKPRADKADAAPRPCPQYGPGFVRVEGSSLCVRAGGSVRMEMGRSSNNRTGSAASAMVELEGRSDSSLGPVRSLVRVRGTAERGLASGNHAYGARY
jgi:hypothetical protein